TGAAALAVCCVLAAARCSRPDRRCPRRSAQGSPSAAALPAASPRGRTCARSRRRREPPRAERDHGEAAFSCAARAMALGASALAASQSSLATAALILVASAASLLEV